MTIRIVRVLSLVALLVLLPSTAVRAQRSAWQAYLQSQASATEAISGVGMVSVPQQPVALRMYVELSGEGKTLEEALAGLKDRREAALVQLQGLGAKKESIWVGPPSLSNPQSARQNQMERMIRQRLVGRGRNVPKGLQVARRVTASATLAAEWPLPPAEPEKLLLTAETLKKKVTEADLAGAKDAAKLSPEEQEMAEEMAEMMRSSGEDQVKTGEPQFVYVARVSREDRDKAMAEAFQKAKAQASRLAQAAGVRLGPLLGLSGQGTGEGAVDAAYYGPYGDYAQQAYRQRLIKLHATTHQADAENEATGTEPARLGFTSYVRATFAINAQ